MNSKKSSLTVKVSFRETEESKAPAGVLVHAFLPSGELLGSAPVKDGVAQLPLPENASGSMLRLVAGPALDAKRSIDLPALRKVGAFELLVKPRLEHEMVIGPEIYLRWPLCRCTVRGRVVKRVRLPDGTTRDLPICHSRVHICEVDRWRFIIPRLPDDIIWRIRDDLLNPKPLPDPIPDLIEPWPSPFPGPRPGPDPVPFADRREPVRLLSARRVNRAGAPDSALSRALPEEVASALKVSASSSVKQALLENAALIRPWLCDLIYLEPFYRYALDCLRVVEVDEDGRFETTIWYSCFGDHPDLYFKVEQLHGATWEWIYRPSIRCHTHWNYPCGSEITIVVTDPSAVPCLVEDPVVPPAGVGSWVMPIAVGATPIWGSPAGAPPAPAGWVRTDGKTDYGSIDNAPFGGALAFRQANSFNIPNNNAKYYRWSYRKAAVGPTPAGDWNEMNAVVYRYYAKERPGQTPTFPALKLGPDTVGASDNLYAFKPQTPPPPDATDPAGTITYWLADNPFGDIYAAFLDTIAVAPNTTGLPGATDKSGVYEIKIEVFNSAGGLVAPSAATFRFIVPTGTAADGVTMLAREATAADLDAAAFVFKLVIDNNVTRAVVRPPEIAGSAVVDDCGFLRYNPASNPNVTLGFTAEQKHERALFSFGVIRGNIPVAAPGVSGDLEDTLAGAPPYARAGYEFSHAFPIASLLGPCTNAAYAASVYVSAKATNGFSRIQAYDSSDTRAFALAI